MALNDLLPVENLVYLLKYDSVYGQYEKEVKAGAKRVILSAPEKTGDVEMVVHGVNKPEGNLQLLSCASCTANCISPVVGIIGRRIGIKKAAMTTIHACTS